MSSLEVKEKERLIQEIELYCKLLKKQAEKYKIDLSNIRFMEG